MNTTINPAAMLAPQDLEDVNRLQDLFSDGEGWDLPKARMQRLAELGLIRRHAANYYSLTAFGLWAVGGWPELPLVTLEDVDARHRAKVAQTQHDAP